MAHAGTLSVVVQEFTPAAVSKFHIPDSIANIKDSYQAKSDKKAPLLIHIQDAHTNTGAQINLAKALDHLIKERGVNTIFIEGGTKDDSLTFLRPLADTKTRERVAKKFLMRGELNGAEYLNLSTDVDMRILGVENKDLYDANLKLYADMVTQRDSIASYIEALQVRVRALKSSIFSKEILQFDELLLAFEKKEKSFTEYHAALSLMAEKNGIHTAYYPNFESLKNLKALEEQINFTKANEEQGKLLTALASEGMIEWHEKLDKIKSQNYTAYPLYAELLSKADENNIRKEDIAELIKYTEYLKAYNTVDFESLLSETKMLESAIYRKALSGTDAYYLYEVSDLLRLLKKLFQFQITPEEFQDYQNYRRNPSFETIAMLAYLNRAFYDRAKDTEILDYVPVIENYENKAKEFYLNNEKRDEVFIERSLMAMKKGGLDKAVLITGGYHTPSLSRLMRRAGISYVVVSPRLSQETNIERYESILLSDLGPENPLKRSSLSVSSQGVGGQTLIARLAAERNGGEMIPRVQMSLAGTEGEGARLAEKNWVTENTPELNDHTVVFRQFEAGLPEPVLEDIRKKHGHEMARFVAQTTLTGGLGALMPDQFDGASLEGVNGIAINVIYDNIKAQHLVTGLPETVVNGTKNLGDYLRDVLTPRKDLNFSMRLNVGGEFKKYAQGRAKSIVDREIKIQVYETASTFGKMPIYYFDAYFEDEDGKKISIFDEVYPDHLELEGYLWRDIHMAVYSWASQVLVQKLQEKGVVKENPIFVGNEVFASLPTPLFPDAFHHHVNHTVFRPGLYQPNALSYEMLGYASYDKPYLVQDGKINVVDGAANIASVVTGVGLYEHTPVLGRDILAAHVDKLMSYNNDGIRNTNGVLLERWQSPLRQDLIRTFKIKLGLTENADDQTLFELLKKEDNSALLEEFKIKNEAIKALDVYVFLDWMAKEQKNDSWLQSVVMDYTADAGQAFPTLEVFQKAIETGREAEVALVIEALMKRPIISNVRRQVDYKGPDKWVQKLYHLRSNQGELADFKKNSSRIVIGGRIFGADAKRMFSEIKRLIKELELEDVITTVENYNIDEAPQLFRAMAGTVMLSDEFLEASATSMMKGVTNSAALIGVWGGAMPELFTIVEKATGREINIFNEDGKPVTHDQLVAHLADETWEIENGFLVRYNDLQFEKSDQRGGGRRPLVLDLRKASFELQALYADPVTRRDLQWEVLASSPKVNIRSSQMRAYAYLWQNAIRRRSQKESFFAKLGDIPSQDIIAILEHHITNSEAGHPFVWNRRSSDKVETVYSNGTGFLGFVEGIRAIRSKGQAGNWSVAYHATHNGAGDIFNFIANTLETAGPKLDVFKGRMEELAKAAESTKDVEKKVILNFQALELMDRLSLQLSWELFLNYLTNDDTDKTKIAGLLSSQAVRENLARYLDRHAPPLFTDSEAVKAYAVEINGQVHAVSINIKEFPETSAKGIEAPAMIMPEKLERLAGEGWNSNTQQMFTWRNIVHPAQSYNILAGDIDKKGLAFTIPPDTHIAVMRLFPKQRSELENLLSLAIKDELTPDKQIAAEKIRHLVAIESSKPGRLEAVLSPIAALTKEEAIKEFGLEGIPAVMIFVGGLAPSLLPRMADWNKEVFEKLSRILSSELFYRGTITFHTTDKRAAIFFSRTYKDETAYFPIYFGTRGMLSQDGKVWFKVNSSPEYLLPGIQEHVNFQVYDYLLDTSYPAIHNKASLKEGWAVGVPVDGTKNKAAFRAQILGLHAAYGARLSMSVSLGQIENGLNTYTAQYHPELPKARFIVNTSAIDDQSMFLESNGDATVRNIVAPANINRDEALSFAINAIGLSELLLPTDQIDIVRMITNAGARLAEQTAFNEEEWLESKLAEFKTKHIDPKQEEINAGNWAFAEARRAGFSGDVELRIRKKLIRKAIVMLLDNGYMNASTEARYRNIFVPKESSGGGTEGARLAETEKKALNTATLEELAEIFGKVGVRLKSNVTKPLMDAARGKIGEKRGTFVEFLKKRMLSGVQNAAEKAETIADAFIYPEKVEVFELEKWIRYKLLDSLNNMTRNNKLSIKDLYALSDLLPADRREKWMALVASFEVRLSAADIQAMTDRDKSLFILGRLNNEWLIPQNYLATLTNFAKTSIDQAYQLRLYQIVGSLVVPLGDQQIPVYFIRNTALNPFDGRVDVAARRDNLSNLIFVNLSSQEDAAKHLMREPHFKAAYHTFAAFRRAKSDNQFREELRHALDDQRINKTGATLAMGVDNYTDEARKALWKNSDPQAPIVWMHQSISFGADKMGWAPDLKRRALDIFIRATIELSGQLTGGAGRYPKTMLERWVMTTREAQRRGGDFLFTPEAMASALAFELLSRQVGANRNPVSAENYLKRIQSPDGYNYEAEFNVLFQLPSDVLSQAIADVFNANYAYPVNEAPFNDTALIDKLIALSSAPDGARLAMSTKTPAASVNAVILELLSREDKADHKYDLEQALWPLRDYLASYTVKTVGQKVVSTYTRGGFEEAVQNLHEIGYSIKDALALAISIKYAFENNSTDLRRAQLENYLAGRLISDEKPSEFILPKIDHDTFTAYPKLIARVDRSKVDEAVEAIEKYVTATLQVPLTGKEHAFRIFMTRYLSGAISSPEAQEQFIKEFDTIFTPEVMDIWIGMEKFVSDENKKKFTNHILGEARIFAATDEISKPVQKKPILLENINAKGSKSFERIDLVVDPIRYSVNIPTRGEGQGHIAVYYSLVEQKMGRIQRLFARAVPQIQIAPEHVSIRLARSLMGEVYLITFRHRVDGVGIGRNVSLAVLKNEDGTYTPVQAWYSTLMGARLAMTRAEMASLLQERDAILSELDALPMPASILPEGKYNEFDIITGAQRFVPIGDVHGDILQTIKLLQKFGIIKVLPMNVDEVISNPAKFLDVRKGDVFVFAGDLVDLHLPAADLAEMTEEKRKEIYGSVAPNRDTLRFVRFLEEYAVKQGALVRRVRGNHDEIHENTLNAIFEKVGRGEKVTVGDALLELYVQASNLGVNTRWNADLRNAFLEVVLGLPQLPGVDTPKERVLTPKEVSSALQYFKDLKWVVVVDNHVVTHAGFVDMKLPYRYVFPDLDAFEVFLKDFGKSLLPAEEQKQHWTIDGYAADWMSSAEKADLAREDRNALYDFLRSVPGMSNAFKFYTYVGHSVTLGVTRGGYNNDRNNDVFRIDGGASYYYRRNTETAKPGLVVVTPYNMIKSDDDGKFASLQLTDLPSMVLAGAQADKTRALYNRLFKLHQTFIANYLIGDELSTFELAMKFVTKYPSHYAEFMATADLSRPHTQLELYRKYSTAYLTPADNIIKMHKGNVAKIKAAEERMIEDASYDGELSRAEIDKKKEPFRLALKLVADREARAKATSEARKRFLVTTGKWVAGTAAAAILFILPAPVTIALLAGISAASTAYLVSDLVWTHHESIWKNIKSFLSDTRDIAKAFFDISWGLTKIGLERVPVEQFIISLSAGAVAGAIVAIVIGNMPVAIALFVFTSVTLGGYAISTVFEKKEEAPTAVSMGDVALTQTPATSGARLANVTPAQAVQARKLFNKYVLLKAEPIRPTSKEVIDDTVRAAEIAMAFLHRRYRVNTVPAFLDYLMAEQAFRKAFMANATETELKKFVISRMVSFNRAVIGPPMWYSWVDALLELQRRNISTKALEENLGADEIEIIRDWKLYEAQIKTLRAVELDAESQRNVMAALRTAVKGIISGNPLAEVKADGRKARETFFNTYEAYLAAFSDYALHVQQNQQGTQEETYRLNGIVSGKLSELVYHQLEIDLFSRLYTKGNLAGIAQVKRYQAQVRANGLSVFADDLLRAIVRDVSDEDKGIAYDFGTGHLYLRYGNWLTIEDLRAFSDAGARLAAFEPSAVLVNAIEDIKTALADLSEDNLIRRGNELGGIMARLQETSAAQEANEIDETRIQEDLYIVEELFEPILTVAFEDRSLNNAYLAIEILYAFGPSSDNRAVLRDRRERFEIVVKQVYGLMSKDKNFRDEKKLMFLEDLIKSFTPQPTFTMPANIRIGDTLIGLTLENDILVVATATGRELWRNEFRPGDSVLLGRAVPEEHIVLSAGNASRIHAELYRTDDGRLYLKDGDPATDTPSKFGTLVDFNIRIKDDVLLKGRSQQEYTGVGLKPNSSLYAKVYDDQTTVLTFKGNNGAPATFSIRKDANGRYIGRDAKGNEAVIEKASPDEVAQTIHFPAQNAIFSIAVSTVVPNAVEIKNQNEKSYLWVKTGKATTGARLSSEDLQASLAEAPTVRGTSPLSLLEKSTLTPATLSGQSRSEIDSFGARLVTAKGIKHFLSKRVYPFLIAGGVALIGIAATPNASAAEISVNLAGSPVEISSKVLDVAVLRAGLIQDRAEEAVEALKRSVGIAPIASKPTAADPFADVRSQILDVKAVNAELTGLSFWRNGMAENVWKRISDLAGDAPLVNSPSSIYALTIPVETLFEQGYQVTAIDLRESLKVLTQVAKAKQIRFNVILTDQKGLITEAARFQDILDGLAADPAFDALKIDYLAVNPTEKLAPKVLSHLASTARINSIANIAIGSDIQTLAGMGYQEAKASSLGGKLKIFGIASPDNADSAVSVAAILLGAAKAVDPSILVPSSLTGSFEEQFSQALGITILVVKPINIGARLVQALRAKQAVQISA